jgi:hypothetical protein
MKITPFTGGGLLIFKDPATDNATAINQIFSHWQKEVDLQF